MSWTLLVTGAVASLAANIAAAEPTMIGRVIAAWPSFALTCSYELLMREIRQSAAARARAQAQQRLVGASGQQAEEPRPETSPPLLSPGVASAEAARADGRPAAGHARNGGRALQRQAWRWALANRRPDGCLPSGTEVARQFQRSERWGRLVKNTGLAGQFGTTTQVAAQRAHTADGPPLAQRASVDPEAPTWPRGVTAKLGADVRYPPIWAATRPPGGHVGCAERDALCAARSAAPQPG
ncbi:MAG TPA: hypothetical protein VIV12_18195 [Streptosporangiaceae bacterium]